MTKIVLFDGSQGVEVALFWLWQDERYEVVALTADENYVHTDTYHDLPMVAFEQVEAYYPPDTYKMFIPLGYKENNHLRARKYYEAKAKGYSFITYIHPRASCDGAKLGENCMVLENVVVSPFSEVGDDVMVWSGSCVGHHSKIGNHVFVAGHAAIGGRAVIGEYTFVGANATVYGGIFIGEENILGAGTVIKKNTSPKSVYMPSRSLKLPIVSDEMDI